ncbi:8562_t:CDS:2 [Funneliformis geosporum]|nr:8562_t:CDS:2 [Funneliformis geosporum]
MDLICTAILVPVKHNAYRTDKTIVSHLYKNSLESNMSKTSSSKSGSGDPKHDSRIFKTIECIHTTGRYSENLVLLQSFQTNNDNEDTFVHDILHDLLKEIFRDPNFELFCESTSSKSRRCISKENSRGKKPDFKLLKSTNDEILFGEDRDSILWGVDLWSTDVAIPTQKSQFISLVSLLEALYTVKDSVSNVLKIITSNTSPSQSRSDYCRLPLQNLLKLQLLGNR